MNRKNGTTNVYQSPSEVPLRQKIDVNYTCGQITRPRRPAAGTNPVDVYGTLCGVVWSHGYLILMVWLNNMKIGSGGLWTMWSCGSAQRSLLRFNCLELWVAAVLNLLIKLSSGQPFVFIPDKNSWMDAQKNDKVFAPVSYTHLTLPTNREV